MTTNIVRVINGVTVLDQLPDGVSIPNGGVTVSDSDYQDLANGRRVWNGTAAVVPVLSLAQVQTSQLAIVAANTAAAITSGIVSSALGTAYTYPSASTDQANLTANVVSSLMPQGGTANWSTPQLCKNIAGVWGYQMHTAAQIQQVGSDVKNAIAGLLVAKAQKDAAIMAATDIPTVKGIV
ncbi:MAG: hypothetical protein WCD45_04025 [Gallionella sp.]